MYVGSNVFSDEYSSSAEIMLQNEKKSAKVDVQSKQMM